MLFTRNRVKQIYDAIASRIHLLLKYKSLGPAARPRIWECFLGKANTKMERHVLLARTLTLLRKESLTVAR